MDAGLNFKEGDYVQSTDGKRGRIVTYANHEAFVSWEDGSTASWVDFSMLERDSTIAGDQDAETGSIDV